MDLALLFFGMMTIHIILAQVSGDIKRKVTGGFILGLLLHKKIHMLEHSGCRTDSDNILTIGVA